MPAPFRERYRSAWETPSLDTTSYDRDADVLSEVVTFAKCLPELFHEPLPLISGRQLIDRYRR
jgi:hypothetical protein